MPTLGQAVEDVLESISDAFVALDNEWRYVYVNRRAGELFGRRPDELIGKHIWTEFPEGVGQTFYHAYHRALEEQVFVQIEDYYPPWGRWFENRIYPSGRGLSIFFQDITERKRAEEALAEEAARRAETEAELRMSETRLRAIIDGSSAAIFVKDLGGRFLLVNQEVERLLRRDHVDIEGRIFDEVFPPPANEVGRRAERAVFERNAEVATEEQVSVDGALRTYLVRRFPLHDDAGAVSAIAAIATDITERAETESALRERERQLAEAQRVAHVGSFEWDMAANHVTWSEELYRIYGLDPQSFGATFETFVERIHPDDRARVAKTIEQTISDGVTFRMEERIIRPTGEVRHLSTRGEVRRDDEGRPVRLVGICHDVTEQHRQRERTEALRDANEALTRTLDLEQVLGALLDSLARFIPDAVASVLLRERRARLVVRALRAYDAAHGPCGHAVRSTSPLREVLGEARTVVVEDTSAHPDWEPVAGASAVRSWIGVPLRAGGEVIGICSLESSQPNAFASEDVEWAEAVVAQAAVAIQNARLHDELQRHAADLEHRVGERTNDLRAAKEEAERANRAKSDFLAGISHELRTPMNAILGFAQLLDLDDLRAEQAESVQQILRAGQHLLQLITELLDIARIEAGELALSLEAVSVSELVGEAIDLTRPQAEESGVSTSATGDLSLHVLGDRQRVLQVLLNLLSNAVKYNRRGGTVELACSREADGLVGLAVSDTGRGIAGADLERLFLPFDRLGLEAGIVDGAGLGLTLARRLVEAMGGTMSVVSTPEVGSTFTVLLPEAADPLAALDAPAIRPGTAETRPATVLYIEDNLANLKLVERALARQPGIKVLAATQGKLGVELAQRQRPDLVLLDLHLPDLAGEEVLDALRSRPETAEIPVVVISAAASKARVDTLKRRGIRAYLTKPVDLRELLELVHDAVNDRGA